MKKTYLFLGNLLMAFQRILNVKLKFLIVLLAICYSTLVKSQIILPIEVIGDEGLTKSVTVNVTDATRIKGLWMLVNNLSYENKASVKINNGPWVQLNNTTVNVPEPAKSYGGIGGGYHVGSIKLTLPLASGSIVNGNNTISFRFEYSDGLSAGFRVVRFNLVDAAGNKVLPGNTFSEDDPNAWTQPIAGPEAAAAGKVLWETKDITEGPNSAIVLRAKCGDCHAKNGRDLKYFNYSNESIIARSKFHKLSQLEAEQIASYIRSLDVPNPGRPWNPPYQPGPGIDSKPVNEWAAGAGIDWVLDKDEMVYPYLFPNGVDTSAISLNKTLNVRETPVMLQFPDWNHWLPAIHPYDASFGGDNFINSAANYLYNGEGTNTQYNYNITNHVEAGPNYKLSNGNLYRSQEELGQNLDTWKNKLIEYTTPFAEDAFSPTGPIQWTKKYADEIYGFRLWHAVKQWEIFNGNDLEGMGKTFYGDKGEERTWPGIYRHVFDVSPHLAKIPREDFTSHNNKEINQVYLSNMWYHVQPVISSGNTHGGGFHVVDWEYAHGNLNDLRKGGTNPNVAEPGRKLILYVKQMQQKHQNSRNVGAENPWFGWDIMRDHNLRGMVYGDSEGLWNQTDPVLARQLMEAALEVWYTKSVSYPPSQYKIGNDGYDVSIHVAGIADMVGEFRAKGINCELLNKIIDFGKSLPQTQYRNWDSLKVSCPVIHYPKVAITSPSNNFIANSHSITVEANATIASGSISRVEFYDDNVLVATDIASPYSFAYTNLQIGSHYIKVKAYDQSGLNASLDSRTVVVNDAPSSDIQAPTVPTNLSSANITQSSFTLNWAASTDFVGVTGYAVYSGENYVGTATGTTFMVTDLTGATAYSMTVRARDAAGNFSLQSNPLIVTTLVPNSVIMETWSNVSGTTVASIPTETTPTNTSRLTSLEITSNVANDYGVRIRGYIIPAITGSYTFYIASDDNGQFSLSTDDRPENLVTAIATVNDYTNSREWKKFPSQQSAAKDLIAGQSYYFEALMKEGGGSENLAIGWTGPGISAIRVIGSDNIDEYVEDTILAVSLTNFTGKASSTGNVLSWRTTAEQNNDGFEILSSTNGVDFKKIGFKKSLSPNGNSGSRLDYTFNDVTSDKDIYYKLNQIDINGKSTSSATIVVKARFATENQVYPNPATNSFNVSTVDSDAKIIVTTLEGRIIKTITANSKVTKIDSSNWSSGMYIIQVNSASGTTVKKVVISK